MTAAQGKTKWNVNGASIRGASHLRSGLPNQDACEYWVSSEGGAAVLAVSDGHGSARHFRSHLGAQLAARTALVVLRNAIEAGNEFSPELPKLLTTAWLSAANAHLQKNPFQEEELAAVVAAEGEEARASIAANPSVAYGATLLVVSATKNGMSYLQLGDGDIIVVDGAGNTTRPLPEDARLIGNQTTSLCQPESWNEFRARFVPGEEPPALVLLSTDGYANSFRSEQDFLQIGRDYLQMLGERGLEGVLAELPAILEEASAKGSGDDITLGLLQRHTGAQPRVAARQTGSSGQEVQKLQAELAAQGASFHQLQASYAKTRKSLLYWQIAVGVLALAILALAGLAHFRKHPEKTQAPVALAKPAPGDKKPLARAPGESRWMLHTDSGTDLPLTSGSKITTKDFGLLRDDALAEVSAEDNGVELKNISSSKWKITEDGKNREVEKNASLRLKNNQQINFGPVTATVTRTSDSRALPLSNKDGTPTS
ncbi:MAG: protein phosphatase 2C domain-containing protein [Acidobacteria bacterium]|nr:protein phosphatase 2C domain-containing protein [Acidobacteriota bacterium]